MIKTLIAVATLGVVGVLFVRSANDARAEPYQVSASQLRDWTLSADETAAGDGAVAWLSPAPELPMNLFRQLFSRQMESMGTPSRPGIALVLRREITADIGSEELLGLAREAGLEQATLTPKCIGFRRISDPGITRQLYFLWFDVPGFDRFRRALTSRAGAGFDPEALSPVLMMAAQPDFTGWQPIVVSQDRDCIAPVTVE